MRKLLLTFLLGAAAAFAQVEANIITVLPNFPVGFEQIGFDDKYDRTFNTHTALGNSSMIFRKEINSNLKFYATYGLNIANTYTPVEVFELSNTFLIPSINNNFNLGTISSGLGSVASYIYYTAAAPGIQFKSSATTFGGSLSEYDLISPGGSIVLQATVGGSPASLVVLGGTVSPLRDFSNNDLGLPPGTVGAGFAKWNNIWSKGIVSFGSGLVHYNTSTEALTVIVDFAHNAQLKNIRGSNLYLCGAPGDTCAQGPDFFDILDAPFSTRVQVSGGAELGGGYLTTNNNVGTIINTLNKNGINTTIGYKANGTSGVTGATCTQWTMGLCTHL